MHLKSTCFRKAFKKLFFLFILIASTATTGLTASIKLRWEANHPAPEGYRVFARQAGQRYDYNQPIWEGKSVTCKLDGLEDRSLYFFVVRAYEGDAESVDSEEVYYAPRAADGDEDGMPDWWELEFGLDYLADDTESDMDDDRISNRDEFRAGLEPDSGGSGTAPDAPIPSYPYPDEAVEPNSVLEVEDYSDADGDAHIATQWQVYDPLTQICLLDVVVDRYTTMLPLPELLLKGDETYRWRARFFDSGGLFSEWSDDSHFLTLSAQDDDDSDGIPKDREGGTAQIDIPDSLVTPKVFSEPTSMEIPAADANSLVEQIALLDPVEFDVHETTPSILPSAMVAYKVVLDQPGQRIQTTIHLSDPAPDGAQWVGYDQIIGWKPYADRAVFSNDRKSVTLEVRDGGFGDADGIANSIIIDAVGLQPLATGQNNGADSVGNIEADAGGGGGCFLRSTQSSVHGVVRAWHRIHRTVRFWYAAYLRVLVTGRHLAGLTTGR